MPTARRSIGLPLLGLALAVAVQSPPSARAAGAACEARSGAERARLVELYTSEGCSSCPPADRWLTGLVGRNEPGVVAIAFHVDYWNALGWRDRFSEAAYGRRQRERVTAEGGRVVYTPQVMVDGRSWSAWHTGGVRDLPGTAGAPGASLEIVREREVNVNAQLADPRQAGAARLYVALVEDGLASSVTAGENRGARLSHDAVVRHLAAPVAFGPDGRAQARLPASMPAGVNEARASWVAFVQRPADGAVLQALRLQAGRCAPPGG